jgi:hypothetical protein
MQQEIEYAEAGNIEYAAEEGNKVCSRREMSIQHCRREKGI